MSESDAVVERAVERLRPLHKAASLSWWDANVSATEDYIARLARESGRSPQAVRSLLERGNELEGLRLALREAKTLAFLIEHAKIAPAAASEPAATGA